MSKIIVKKNDKFVKRLVTLGLPLLLQYLVISSLNLVDNVMIGNLGKISINAVAVGNQIFFLVNLFIVGVTSGTGIFFSQYWGKRDIKSIHKTLGIALMVSIIVASVFTILALSVPGQIVGLYSKDAGVINEGIIYLRVAAFSYIPFAISMAMVFALRSIGNVKLPLIVSIIALGINTFLNYCLIFGNFGMPELGVKGAAIATVTARLVEATLIVSIVYLKKYPIAGKMRDLFSFSSFFFKKIMNKVALVMLNEGVWAIGTTGYSIIYGRMGVDELAVMSICMAVFNIGFVFAEGVGVATGVLVGNSLGAGDFEQAKSDAKKSLPAAFICGMIVSLIVLSLRSTILSFYNVSPEVLQQASIVLIAIIAFLPLNGIAFTLFIGVLRAGGDTRFCAIVDMVAVWCIGLPLAWLGAFVFKFPVLIVFILARMESTGHVVMCFIRYRSLKWVNDLTITME